MLLLFIISHDDLLYYSFTTTSSLFYYYYYYYLFFQYNNNSNVLRVGEVVRAKKRHKDRWYARLCAIARQIDEWALPVV